MLPAGGPALNSRLYPSLSILALPSAGSEFTAMDRLSREVEHQRWSCSSREGGLYVSESKDREELLSEA